jgi:hypothetical protein
MTSTPMPRSRSEERAGHAVLVDLMTPVVQAACTAVGLQIADLGIQVHGGSGHVESTGAAQYWRDLRVCTVYENSTGIQAKDMIGRKVMRDGGASYRATVRGVEPCAGRAAWRPRPSSWCGVFFVPGGAGQWRLDVGPSRADCR